MNFSLLVAHFCSTYVSLVSEAQLNYGDPNQSEEETIEALGEFNIVGTCEIYEGNFFRTFVLSIHILLIELNNLYSLILEHESQKLL